MKNWKYSKTPINHSFKTQQSIFSCIETRIDKITPNEPPYLYACFQLGFFPSNQGLTLANALRRSLLNETTECSITGVIIENVKHEYSSIFKHFPFDSTCKYACTYVYRNYDLLSKLRNEENQINYMYIYLSYYLSQFGTLLALLCDYTQPPTSATILLQTAASLHTQDFQGSGWSPSY